MLNMARYPMTQMIAGEIMVVDKGTLFEATGSQLLSRTLPRTFDFQQFTSFAKHIAPEITTTGTLWIPFLPASGLGNYLVIGRFDETRNPLYLPPITQGELPDYSSDPAPALATTSPRGMPRIGQMGAEVSVRLPAYRSPNPEEFWDLPGGPDVTYQITGVCQPTFTVDLITPLEPLQKATGALGLVNMVGVSCPDPMRVNDVAERLAKAMEAEKVPLQAITADTLISMLVADFARFERTSVFYGPAMVLISTLIVISTGLAMAVNRRRELAVLHTLGLSPSAVRLLFTAECTAAALCGSALGYVASMLLAGLMFRSVATSPLPAVSAVIVTMLVSLVSAPGPSSRELQDVLRNP